MPRGVDTTVGGVSVSGSLDADALARLGRPVALGLPHPRRTGPLCLVRGEVASFFRGWHGIYPTLTLSEDQIPGWVLLCLVYTSKAVVWNSIIPPGVTRLPGDWPLSKHSRTHSSS